MRQAGTAAHLFIVFLWTTKADKPLYGAVGKEVALTPGPVTDPITSITWKHGLDMAMEWYKGETFSYRQFKVRGSLNSSTGALTITGLTQSDSGIYTAEINQYTVPKQTHLLVISPVSRPSISTSCDADMTYCVFTCEGNTTDAEPVTYKWKDVNWISNNTYTITITKETKSPSFRCILENPVSSEKSESVLNPFTQSFRNRNWILTCLIPLVGVILSYLIYRFIRRKRRSVTLSGCQETPNRTACGASAESSNGTVILEVQEPAQDSTSPVSPDTCNGTERSPAIPETSNQDSTFDVSADTCNETERSPLLPADHEPPHQTTSGGTPESSNGTELQEPAQDSTSPVSPDTCNETERSPAIPETSNQDSTSDVSADTCNETADQEPPHQTTSGVTPESSNETELQESSQDSTSPVSPDTCNETESPAVTSSGEETSGSQETTVD